MMSDAMRLKLKRSIEKHEGFRARAYRDSIGKVTVGYGYNVTDRGEPNKDLEQQYEDDVLFFYGKLSEYPWFLQLNEDRQIVLIDMMYNIGVQNFKGFRRMIDSLAHHDYGNAAKEMIKSRWSEQVGGRARELAQAMRTGEYDI